MKRVLLISSTVTFLLVARPTNAFLAEEEIIYPQNLPVCNEFNIEYRQETEVTGPLPSSIQSATTEKNLQKISGRLEVKDTDFPDFAAMENNFFQALAKILPQELKKQVSLDERALKTKFTHYPQAQDENNKVVAAEKNPEATFNQPAWFTKMLGETKILCGLLGTCSAPKSLNIKVVQSSLESSPLPEGYCQSQQNISGDSVESLQNPQPEFTTKTWWQKITDYVEDWINKIFRRKTTQTATFLVRGAGPMIGGQTMSQQVTFADSFLPAEFGLQGNQRRTNETDIQLSENFNIVGDQKFKTPSAKIQKSLCLMQAGLYPSEINAFENHPVCTSRSADDYPLNPDFYSLIDDLPLDMSLCQRDPDTHACHYFDPNDSPRCDGDPICESGRCNPYEFRLRRDYTDRGCSPPYSGECNNSQLCRAVTFKANPAGGFGACQYQNATVCVRADRVATGSCAAVCNWACCAWQ